MVALRTIAFVLFLNAARAAIVSSLPPFALKLIVVEETPEFSNRTEFRDELSAITAKHLERSLTLALVTPVDVSVEIAGYLYAVLDDDVEGNVVLAVVNVGFQGVAAYDGAEIDITPHATAALSQDTGFWDLAKAVVNSPVLNDVAKLQVAMGNEITGEGNLVPDDSAESDEADDPDEENVSNTGLIVAVTMCTIVSVVLLVGCAIFWRYNHEQQLEQKKAEKRQLARQRRMMDNDRSSSYSYASREQTLNSSDSGTKKAPAKTHKRVITKPSKEARKEKRLLRIIEQSEEGSDDKDDDQYVFARGNESSLLSLQSCQSSLTASLTASPQKLAKGWNEQDVPAYMRNSRGFHTGALPEKLKDSPTPSKHSFQGSSQKTRSPASWDTASTNHGPFSNPDKVGKAGADKSRIVKERAHGILRKPDSMSVPSKQQPKPTAQLPQPKQQPVMQQPRYGAGNESLANLNFSGSIVSNQQSITSSASSNCDHVPEMFLNDGPQKSTSSQQLSMAHDSMALIKSPRTVKQEEMDSYNNEVGISFDMSCANFDMMNNSDMFQECLPGESISLDEFNNGFDDIEHSISVQSGSNNSSAKRSSKGSSASWRFT